MFKNSFDVRAPLAAATWLGASQFKLTGPRMSRRLSGLANPQSDEKTKQKKAKATGRNNARVGASKRT